MSKVRIYTTRICPYCIMAKRLFDSKSVSYEEIDVSTDHETRAWLVTTTGQRTVPQVFVGERSLGGYQETAAMDASGELDELLSAAPANPGI